jgi:glycine/D-amino acid oxidase-like deaminating enzyme
MAARGPDRAVVADITRGLRDRFGALRGAEPARAWGGWIAMTPSWLPVAGAAGPRVAYAVGYNGHGIAQAPYLGTLVADRLAGDAPHEHLETLWKKRPRFAPAPLFSGPALRLAWALDRVGDRFAAARRRA